MNNSKNKQKIDRLISANQGGGGMLPWMSPQELSPVTRLMGHVIGPIHQGRFPWYHVFLDTTTQSANSWYHNIAAVRWFQMAKRFLEKNFKRYNQCRVMFQRVHFHRHTSISLSFSLFLCFRALVSPPLSLYVFSFSFHADQTKIHQDLLICLMT